MSDEEKKIVKLRWQPAEDLPTIYANHLQVSHAGMQDFFLIFGEAHAPAQALAGGEEEDIKEVAVRPVAKIALSPGTMIAISNAISMNIASYLTNQAKAKAHEAEDDDDSTN